MKPDISEFSYGYALTEALIWDTGLSVIGAPLFPSLIQEGRPGGGYDVALPFSGLLLFLQFKLSDYMRSRGVIEAKNGLIDTPFYRMHLRPKRHSRQHTMLLELEAAGETVFYAAPKFYLAPELNEAYLNQTMIPQSFFIRPSTIGPLPDDLDHHVSFRDGYPVYLCSEPRKLREEENRETSLKALHSLLEHSEYKKYDDDVLGKLNEQMLNIILRQQISLRRTTINSDNARTLKNMNPVEKLRYLSRTYFDCEPVVIKARRQEE